MPNKTASLVISLAIIGLVGYGLWWLARSPQVNRVRGGLAQKVGRGYDNVVASNRISRMPPIATIELEERLKANMANPFAQFTLEDWQWFWSLLYDKASVPSSDWPQLKRQLYREEIEYALIDNYYQPFGSFSEQQWSIFWQRILDGKVFK